MAAEGRPPSDQEDGNEWTFMPHPVEALKTAASYMRLSAELRLGALVQALVHLGLLGKEINDELTQVADQALELLPPDAQEARWFVGQFASPTPAEAAQLG
jgi:hypothetical protein